jgi:hypothetical protein
LVAGLGAPPGDIDAVLRGLWEKLPRCGWYNWCQVLLRAGRLPRQASGIALGGAPGGQTIEAYFFPGTSKERALVVGGVHGSELSGIEVAKRLVQSLAGSAAAPHFNVLVIPELFPDNAARARAANPSPGQDSNTGRTSPYVRCPKYKNDKGKRVCADPNREFPPLGQPFDTSNPVDALRRKIEPENVSLLDVIRFYRPTRIASVHAHSVPKSLKRAVDGPGIFADPHPPKGDKVADAHTQSDCQLALAMARHAQQRGARLPANWLATKTPTCSYGSRAAHQPGISLGGWGPSQGISVITVEVQHYYPSNAGGTPTARSKHHAPETATGVKNRLKELQAYVSALQDVFLGPP